MRHKFSLLFSPYLITGNGPMTIQNLLISMPPLDSLSPLERGFIPAT